MKTKTHTVLTILVILVTITMSFSCNSKSLSSANHQRETQALTAKDILGNPDYAAICYGGYRKNSRDTQPTIAELKEDMKILAAMQIKILRTYNTKFAQASNVLKAIHELKTEDSSFEMYVMLGAWINCQGAFTPNPNHEEEDAEANEAEINRAVALANQYPDIVKIIAVGNEAMVKWATSYFVQPKVILKWVNHLQTLKIEGKLAKDLWVTSSDNFASWGGGGGEYHVEDLTKLAQAVDYISLHTYPMHDTHYNPQFWGVTPNENAMSNLEKITFSMEKARDYAKSQYQNTAKYMQSIGISKPIHIGETGWATASNGFYGENGTKATDEYKSAQYYELMREWTNEDGISCFYFEAFDEPWKDSNNPGGSENHFGIFKTDGKAKYAVWKLVDRGVFEGLTRDGNPITKTFNGDKEALLKQVLLPPPRKE